MMIKKHILTWPSFIKLCLMLFFVIFIYLFACAIHFGIDSRVNAAWTDSGCYAQKGEISTQTIDGVEYRIVDAPEKLAYFATTTTSYNIMVVKNLDLSDYLWTTPICKNSPYTGIFDGGGCEIKGLTNYNGVGLFGTVSLSIIKNVTLTNVYISSWFQNINNVGAIAGEMQSSNLENCIASGKITVQPSSSSEICTGGIVGKTTGTVVSGCQNYININAYRDSNVNLNVGGIVGRASNSISNCVNFGNISGIDNDGHQNKQVYVGGIVGYSSSIVYYCANYGSVESRNGTGYTEYENTKEYNYPAYAGGIAGYCSSSIRDCFNMGKIMARSKHIFTNYFTATDETKYDGLKVHDHKHGGYHEEAWYSGWINKSEKSYINAYAGGICGGCSSTVSNCYNTGVITGGYYYEYKVSRHSLRFWENTGTNENHSKYIYAYFSYGKSYVAWISGEGSSLSNCHMNDAYYNKVYTTYDHKDNYGNWIGGDDSVAIDYIIDWLSISLEKIEGENKTVKECTTGETSLYIDFSDVEVKGNRSNPKLTVTVNNSYNYNTQTNVTTRDFTVSVGLSECWNDGWKNEWANNRATVNSISYSCSGSLPPSQGMVGKTDEQMQNSGFAGTLGSNWAYDANINGGYPYLKNMYWGK